MKLIDQLKAARRVCVPIVAVETPDPGNTTREIVEQLNGDAAYIGWDVVNGFEGLNDAGEQEISDRAGGNLCEGNPVPALKVAAKFAPQTVVIMANVHRFLDNAMVVQGIWNLRDQFKQNFRMLILLGSSFKLPEELKNDVVTYDQPLPDDDELEAIVREQVAAAGDQLQFEPNREQLKRAAAAVKGCSAFAAEQLAAMALRKDRIDVEQLHNQAKHTIEQTPGLEFERGGETFDDIGGLAFLKGFGRRMFEGSRAPSVIVRVEELEKTMAGAKGDLSGTSGDALQVLLSEMEDNDYSGLLAYGIPGSGKSLASKAIANTFGAKAIRLDLNATKNSLVGSSEQRIRAAMKVIHTIGGSRVFFVASVNRLESLPPELQRRFRAGCWYFDVPSAEDRKAIWRLNVEKFGIDDSDLPDEDELTGADIRNICEMASMLSVTPREALDYVVPFKIQSPDAIAECRRVARHRFVDASRGGVYRTESKTTASRRRKVTV